MSNYNKPEGLRAYICNFFERRGKLIIFADTTGFADNPTREQGIAQLSNYYSVRSKPA